MKFAFIRPVLTIAAALLVTGLATPAFAQDDEEAALTKAHEAFVEVLDNTNNVFYKSQTNDNGGKFYTVIFELNGVTTKMIYSLKIHGTYNGQTIVGLSGWTIVSESENPFPPAVIKAVATTNDRLTLGSISTSTDFKTIYTNVTATADGLSPGVLWLYCAYLQENVKNMKAIADEAIAASGR